MSYWIVRYNKDKGEGYIPTINGQDDWWKVKDEHGDFIKYGKQVDDKDQLFIYDTLQKEITHYGRFSVKMGTQILILIEKEVKYRADAAFLKKIIPDNEVFKMPQGTFFPIEEEEFKIILKEKF